MNRQQYIYILSNPSMPNLIKIGKTTKLPKHRINELNTTGVPTAFILELSVIVKNCHEAERFIHNNLQKYRVAKNREFFKISVEKATKIILSIISNYEIDYCKSNSVFKFKKQELEKLLAQELLFIKNLQVKIKKRNSVFAVIIMLSFILFTLSKLIDKYIFITLIFTMTLFLIYCCRFFIKEKINLLNAKKELNIAQARAINIKKKLYTINLKLN